MAELLHLGRRFWYIVRLESIDPYVVGPLLSLGFKQFCPAGPVIDPVTGKETGHIRKKGLVQVYTDPGGLRTIAAADIRLDDPRRK
jgi:hypothetical protein